jgi:hypothetical protein
MPIALPATVDSKPVIILNDGTEIIDLTQQSLDIKQTQPMTNFVLVNEETSMRIDAISQIALSSIIHTEKMLKFNDISNPFIVDVGDILFVPDLVYANINMKTGSGTDTQKFDIRNQYIDPEKDAKLDPTLGKFDKRNMPKKADPTKTAPPLPPNFANIGDREIEIKGGKIYFGPNVSKNGNECEEPLSKSEFLAKLIKNRINK